MTRENSSAPDVPHASRQTPGSLTEGFHFEMKLPEMRLVTGLEASGGKDALTTKL